MEELYKQFAAIKIQLVYVQHELDLLGEILEEKPKPAYDFSKLRPCKGKAGDLKDCPLCARFSATTDVDTSDWRQEGWTEICHNLVSIYKGQE